MWVFVCIYMCAYEYVCMCVCVYMCVYMRVCVSWKRLRSDFVFSAVDPAGAAQSQLALTGVLVSMAILLLAAAAVVAAYCYR